MNGIKKQLKKSKMITSLYRIIVNSIFSLRNTTLQGLMTKQEKRMRKKFNISLNVSTSFLDSRTFWFFYNCTQNIVAKHNPHNWLVVDAGASNGWYTTQMIKLLPKSTFLMYEPLQKFHETNKALTHVNNRINYIQKALSNVNEEIDFYENQECDGLSSSYLINKDYKHFDKDFNNQKSIKYKVSAVKLDDDICNNKRFNKFENIFLKMDVQGGR